MVPATHPLALEHSQSNGSGLRPRRPRVEDVQRDAGRYVWTDAALEHSRCSRGTGISPVGSGRGAFVRSRMGRLCHTHSLAALAVLTFTFCTVRVHAQDPSARGDELVFGMSTVLTGPAAKLGLNMRAGVLAAFAEANQAGGIHGRKLRLIALDDGYEPARTTPNMHTLIGEHRVLAVMGNVGTPTAVAAIPIANVGKTAFFGAFTGAGALRKIPPDRYVINYRASYAEETAAMVDALIKEAGLRPEEVAFFTQRDAYGDAGYVGGIEALKRHGLDDVKGVAHGRYERNTNAVENGLADILAARTPARAVILVGAYEPCATFIKLAGEYGLDAFFLNVSFVGAAPLAKALGAAGDGVIVTQVVPHPEADLPATKAYRKALRKSDPDAVPTFGSLEGYIVGRILIKALADIDGTPTREAVVNALEGLGDFDIGLGCDLALNPTEHQASHRLWPTVIHGGKVVPLAWEEFRRRQGGSGR